MSELPDAVVVEADLEEAPDKVWRALSEPDLLEAWLFPNDIRPEPGERFALEDGGRRIDCEVLEAEPGRTLRYSWREADAGVDSEVSFLLTPAPGGGTHLRVVHAPVVVSLAAARARRGARLAFAAPRTNCGLRRAA
ncbi:MAG: SRPBCC domain-containing protein [Caulobacterales bacterium]